jgi:hypothetical protein
MLRMLNACADKQLDGSPFSLFWRNSQSAYARVQQLQQLWDMVAACWAALDYFAGPPWASAHAGSCARGLPLARIFSHIAYFHFGTQMTNVTTSDLATAWGITPQRVTQLAQMGVPKKSPDGGFDELASHLGYIAFLKKDESTRDSRNRARDAQSIRQEQRYIRELRQLLTLDEVHAITNALCEEMLKYAQAEGQRTFDELAQTMSEMDARVWTYEKVFDPVRAAALAFRDGTAAYISALREGMADEGRIQAIVADLRRRIGNALDTPANR